MRGLREIPAQLAYGLKPAASVLGMLLPLAAAVPGLPRWLRITVLLGGAALQLGILMTTLLVRGRDRSLTAQRLRGLDRVDPATGLSTPAVVMERLRRMTARAQRQEHQIAVLLIDLVNLGELRQLYGRRVDQEMPLRLANRLLHVMREIDTIGRSRAGARYLFHFPSHFLPLCFLKIFNERKHVFVLLSLLLLINFQ